MKKANTNNNINFAKYEVKEEMLKEVKGGLIGTEDWVAA